MPTLINRSQVLDNPWLSCDAQTLAAAINNPAPEYRHLLLDWATWSEQAQPLQLPAGKQLGLTFPNTEEPDLLKPYFNALSLIALEFPLFTDGRAYSQARMLREMGFKGELRATGNVLPDQLYYMARCGFDTFLLTEGKDPEVALRCFKSFTVAYQSAADGKKPVYCL